MHSSLTQLLNIFYQLKDSKSLLFSKFSPQLLNCSRNIFRCFIIFSPHFIFLEFRILLSVTIFIVFFFPGTLESWCLLSVTIQSTVFIGSFFVSWNAIFIVSFGKRCKREIQFPSNQFILQSSLVDLGLLQHPRWSNF